MIVIVDDDDGDDDDECVANDYRRCWFRLATAVVVSSGLVVAELVVTTETVAD